MIAVCTGCKCPKTSTGRTGYVGEVPANPNEPPPDVSRINISDPSGNSGTLGVPITQFSSGDNGQSCFPAAQGWNLYWVTFYFLGPNATASPNNYPNLGNTNSVTIDTLDTANGTALDTGIVILDNLNPANKVCNDDAAPPFTNNPKLSKATFTPTGNGKKYRAGIFYKGPTPPGLTNIVVHWSYP
jgi:hypothetical protein